MTANPLAETANRRRVWPKRAAMVLLGLVAGSSIAELTFRARDRGAFPHLHIYLEDPELGVRLEPGATQKVALPGDRVTTVRINTEGLRGGALPESGDREVIVVGDSQVFGLGVEERETFSALLQGKLEDRRVINAGVPTYGPLEYEKVAARLVVERKPAYSADALPGWRRTLVYVINLSNDLAEANRPNKERHKIWDGWAVRADTAPTSVSSFPGRDWLFRESHAFYALRSFLYARGPQAGERLLPSEGEVRDLLGAAGVARGKHAQAHADTEALARLWRDELEKAGNDESATKEAWQKLLQEVPEAIPGDRYSVEYKRNKGDPGDLVERGETFFEGGGKADYAYLVKGAAVRQHVEDMILARAKDVLAAEKRKLVLDSFAAREEAEKRVAALRKKSLEIVRAWSPLRPSLERMKKLCDDNHVDLVVVVLPIDVQVSPTEWQKYGRAPVDMAATRILNRDIVDTARSLGVLVVDLLPTLEQAEPGAFFERDLHLTPKGHEAVAARLFTAFDEEKPPSPSPLVLSPPSGRTHVPLPSAWRAAKPFVTNTDILFATKESGVADGSKPMKGKQARFRGKIPEGCEAKRVDEWFRVVCAKAPSGLVPTGVLVRKGPPGDRAADVMSAAASGVAMVIAPMVADTDRLEVDFAWGDVTRTLVLKLETEAYGLPAGTSTYEWSLTFDEPKPVDATNKASFASTPGMDALCACQKSTAPPSTPESTCAELVGAPDHDCTQTYGSDCKRLLECVRGELASLPTCQPGWRRAGASHRCHRSCDAQNACGVGGVCAQLGIADGSPWSVCLAPFAAPVAVTPQ